MDVTFVLKLPCQVVQSLQPEAKTGQGMKSTGQDVTKTSQGGTPGSTNILQPHNWTVLTARQVELLLEISTNTLLAKVCLLARTGRNLRYTSCQPNASHHTHHRESHLQ